MSPNITTVCKEESEALHTMVSVISEQKKADSVLDPALATLIEDR